MPKLGEGALWDTDEVTIPLPALWHNEVGGSSSEETIFR